MPDARLPERPLDIAEAFARLPLETPGRSAWPRLAERLAAAEARRPRPRWPFALAAAAALVLALALPRRQTEDAPGVTGQPLVAGPGDEASLPALMQESARLEHVPAVTNDQAGSASAMVLGLQLEDELQRLDATLSQPGLDEQARLDLWQQRVGLLRDYASLQGTRQVLAAEGEQLEGDLVAVY
jgi:hypothetical protein